MGVARTWGRKGCGVSLEVAVAARRRRAQKESLSHLLGGSRNVAIADVNSSGADPPAAMKVAPATSSSTPRPLYMTSSAGTKYSSHCSRVGADELAEAAKKEAAEGKSASPRAKGKKGTHHDGEGQKHVEYANDEERHQPQLIFGERRWEFGTSCLL